MNLHNKLDSAFNSILSDLRNVGARNTASRRPYGTINNIHNGDVNVSVAPPHDYNPCGEIPLVERHYRIPPIQDVCARRVVNESNSAFSQPKQENKIMSLLGNIPGLSGAAFGKVSDKRIAVGFDGQVVFRKPDGSYVKVVTDSEGNRTQVGVLDLKLDVDFYRVPAQQLNEGDLIELDGQFLYVEEKGKGGVKFVNPLTGNKSAKLQQTNIFGLHFYSKIVSLFELGGAQAGIGLGGINPIMLMALQGKNGAKGDISELLVLSALAGAQGGEQSGLGGIFGGGAGGINPMMMMMLGGDADNDSFKQMMMLQMMAGQGGANPFAPISANVQAVPVVAKATAKKAAPRKTATKAAVPAKAAAKSAPAKKAVPAKATRAVAQRAIK